mmetsp:Transcript_31863/g.59927  ORF Transcript_31863/g.59927 Transcript_31863/m.59927 type:complete len:253 (+) Transcript_31863:51-809(+)
MAYPGTSFSRGFSRVFDDGLYRPLANWAWASPLALSKLQEGCETSEQCLSDGWDAAAWFHSLPEEPREILVVNSTDSNAFVSLCWDLMTADVVAFDAEWVPDERDSDHPISVLQFAFPTTCQVYVLQLHRIGKIPPPVQQMLVNPWVTKVGFGVDCKDADKFITTGIRMYRESVVDMQQVFADLLGRATYRFGLRRAANDLLGYALDKDASCTCSDWSARDLSPEQVKYAALDAWVTLRLFYLSCVWTPWEC